MARRFDSRKLWSLRDARIGYQAHGAAYPVLTATIDGGPEDGRRVVMAIDPAEWLAMAQAMVAEAEAQG